MMVCLDRDTGPVHPAVCSAAPSTGRIGMSFRVTARIGTPPFLDILRVDVSAPRAGARPVPQRSIGKIQALFTLSQPGTRAWGRPARLPWPTPGQGVARRASRPWLARAGGRRRDVRSAAAETEAKG